MHMFTKKRQDVIGGGLLGLVWPDRDRITFDIPIDSELPLEILVCRKVNVKQTQQDIPSINQLIAPVQSKPFYNTSLAVLAESPE